MGVKRKWNVNKIIVTVNLYCIQFYSSPSSYFTICMLNQYNYVISHYPGFSVTTYLYYFFHVVLGQIDCYTVAFCGKTTWVKYVGENVTRSSLNDYYYLIFFFPFSSVEINFLGRVIKLKSSQVDLDCIPR